MATVYSYSRFSSKEQAKGDSLRRQIDARDEFVKKGRHKLADLLLDDKGVSAFRGKNAASGKLGRFLELVRDGTVKQGAILCVENLDRMNRQRVTEHLNLFLSILTAGVQIYTTMDGKLYSHEGVNENPMDLMMSILIMARAHEETCRASPASDQGGQGRRVTTSTCGRRSP